MECGIGRDVAGSLNVFVHKAGGEIAQVGLLLCNGSVQTDISSIIDNHRILGTYRVADTR